MNIALRKIWFFVILIVPVTASTQSLSDTLKLEEVRISTGRKIESTGITGSGIDSLTMNMNIDQSLSELLSENTHVFIKSYGRGSFASASFRGTAPSHTKVSWNGLELNSPMLGMVDFSQLPVYLVDEIKLYHGNSSMTNLPGALGGLLDLTTKVEREQGFSGSFLAGAGSFGTRDGYVKFNLGGRNFYSVTRVFYNHSDNDFSFVNKDQIDSVDRQSGKKYRPRMKNRNAGFTNKGIMQQFSYRQGNNGFLDLSLWLQQSGRSLPILSTDESRNYSNLNRQTNDIFRSALNYAFYKDRLKVKVFSGVNYNSSSYYLDNYLNDSTLLREVDSKSRALAFENKLGLSYSFLSRHKADIKFRYLLSSVDSYEDRTRSGYDTSRNDLMLIASEYSKWTDRIRTRLTLALQMSDFELQAFTWNVGGEYHLMPEKWYVSMNVAKNLKVPTLNDLYYQPGGNAALLPEISRSIEAGMNYHYNGSRTEIKTALSAFTSEVDNWIIWLPGFKGYWEPVNIDKVKSSGIEATASILKKAGEWHFRLRGNYAYTQSLNLGSKTNWADESIGKQLPYIPLHSANLNIFSGFKTWALSYTWNYFSVRYTTSSNEKSSFRDYLYPYFMSQLRFTKSFALKKYSISSGFTVYNLFNEEYRSVLQRPMPGRNYHLLVKIDF